MFIKAINIYYQTFEPNPNYLEKIWKSNMVYAFFLLAKTEPLIWFFFFDNLMKPLEMVSDNG